MDGRRVAAAYVLGTLDAVLFAAVVVAFLGVKLVDGYWLAYLAVMWPLCVAGAWWALGGTARLPAIEARALPGLVARGILVGVELGLGTAVVLTGAVGGFWAWLVAIVVGPILGALFALVNILLLARMRALQGKEPIHRSRSV